jgi:hypothetical protein
VFKWFEITNNRSGFFEREVTKLFARNCLHRAGYKEEIDKIPRPLQIRLLHEYIGNNDRRTAYCDDFYGSRFFENIHLSVDFLTAERQRSDESIDRHAVSLDVCESFIRSGFHYCIMGGSMGTTPDQSAIHIQSTYFLIAIIMQWSEVQNVMLSANNELLISRCRYFGYPLAMAIQLGYTHTVRMLAEAGVEMDTDSRPFWEALKEAARSGHAEVIDYFVHETTMALDDLSLTLWGQVAEEAAANGHPNVSMTLLAKYTESLGLGCMNRLLSKAASHGSNDLVRKLLEFGIVPYSIPLRNAAGGGHLSTCKLILECFTDDGKRRLDLKGIWRSVAKGGEIEILELMIQHGVPMNNKSFILPLAVEYGNLNMAKYAVSRSFHEGGKKQIPRNEMKHSKKSLYFSLFRAIDCEQSEIVRWFIKDLGLHPDGLEEPCIGVEFSPLALAIDSGSAKMAKLLVELGARPLSEEFPGEPSTKTARFRRGKAMDKLRMQLNLGKPHSRDYYGVDGKIIEARKAAACPSYDPGTGQ